MPMLAEIRDPVCTRCRMSNGAAQVCLMGRGPTTATVMVVGKMPNSAKWQEELDEFLRDAGLDPQDSYYTAAVKCRTFELQPSNGDVKQCRTYLDQEIELIKPKWILALGNEALLSLTGHSGIMKWRGRIIKHQGYSVIPTISPSAVKRNPGQAAGFAADLRFFASQVNGTETGIEPPEIHIIDTPAKVKLLRDKVMPSTRILAYDLETWGESEFAPGARIVSLSGTCLVRTKSGTLRKWAFFLPLGHPESPFKTQWKGVLKYLADCLVLPPVRIGHNGKYDDRWLRTFGVPKANQTFDTLLAAHVLDENRPKGLKPLAQTLLGVSPWAIETRDLLTTPLDEIAIYNTLDTWYTFHLHKVFRDQLKKDPRKRKVFKHILMASSSVYTESELAGVWMDVPALMTNRKIAWDMRDDVDRRLMDWVPGHSPENTPTESELTENGLTLDDWLRGEIGWPTMGKKAKLSEINFNASNWLRWWLFDYLELPVLERGKEKDDGGLGAPSVREGVLLELRKLHPAVDVLLERTKWQKYCSSFLDTYLDLLDSNDRIHTSFKLHGTVTGRTSSGKTDEEKITGRVNRRGVNLQQVPRDTFIRGLFGAPPGYAFVEADQSQIELRLAAFLARERTMLRLYQIGADIHRTTAARVTGIPESEVPSEVRKKIGKPVNFGFLYGMSWRKFIQTAFENYGAEFSEQEARAFRDAYFELYGDLQRWHAKQRRLVREYGRVESPLGRVRHLPDIRSGDAGVRAEAERQAINSPVQSFGSDITLLGMTQVHARFKAEKIPARIIGTVHDAINFEIRLDALKDALPIIKHEMENPKLEELFGVVLDVPLIADVKVGERWGGAHEVTPEQVFNWEPELWNQLTKS